MSNGQKVSGRAVNKKRLVSGRDPYSFENQLKCCEVNVDDDDNECDDDDDYNNNNSNNDMDFHKMAVLRTAHVFTKVYNHSS